ncbi:Zn(II)2Cys6 transcription factor [Aspergillus homomorphus CBS 101889]|uniref:Zn(2)-C6 fungal-type domain-containing protein n=1 Tax=Aspergillus homomorphus (strain CBS 101889) TaxID=1450537 RepID=A0A395HLL1_ASPHC|nr:hypothetical protein BO97DRAFT_397569 [Aspergillus homomorphus CBS 101889]RAL08747.1 hypothetical protein BO97DRAFT_397569 [Aspergillus homomorphus CBS 101889]
MLTQRKKTFSKRSRTGCRTCRARRVKCDETPVACLKCTGSGRTCDGYDRHRLAPAGGRRKTGDTTPIFTIPANLARKLQWNVTSDERRCLSFFQHRSVQHLVGLYDSFLWQQVIFRLCCKEPAVYHAVVALGAVNQANELTGCIPRPGQSTTHLQNTWYRFALEQSGRSVALLNKRRMSQDPQLQETILVCCLLFIICELLHGNRNRADFHLKGGLRILQMMKLRRQSSGLQLCPAAIVDGPSGAPVAVEDCVVETFLKFQESSVYFGTDDPLDFDSQFVFNQPYDNYLLPFHSLEHAKQVLKPLTQANCIFTAVYLKASDSDLQKYYASLQHQQVLLLSYFHKFLWQFERFCAQEYTSTPTDGVLRKEEREAELIKLACRQGIMAAKVALYNKSDPWPASLCLECESLIAASEAAMSKFGGQYPAVTAETGIMPALVLSIFRCPDYGIRCRGIEAIRSWQSEEGFLSAVLSADIMEEGMKKELRWLYDSGAPWPRGVTFVAHGGRVTARVLYWVGAFEKQQCLVLERNESLIAELAAIETAKDWSCVKAWGLMDEQF